MAQALATTASGAEIAGPRYCIGVDVGGTFTDVVLSDGQQLWSAKAPSTHGAIGEGVLHGVRMAAEQAGMTLDGLLPLVDRFGLGTTAVTNVIASRVGRHIGLITTAGFEDLVPIARVRRIPRNGWLVPPDALVERACIRGVSERIDREGTILQQLDPQEAVAAAKYLVEQQGVEAITVSFLWGCINAVHEEAATQAIQAALPNIDVVSAAALLPVMREYERTTFALLNSYTGRALDGVDALVDRLADHGLRNAPLLVHSGGGSISVQEGRRTPATLAESGPAAGVVGALAVCEAAGVTDAVACDMGGTSYDISIIRDSQAIRRTRGELMGIWTALPMVDIESITAGGGSIGWADAMGCLHVGPRSAGAVPGPACYGRGGTDATVTDALVVLGYLDPDGKLSGGMALDASAALRACQTLGDRIGVDAHRTAWGIREIALTEMQRALRAQFAQKGVDPRDFALVSMGGCGGLFNAVVAQELGMRRMLAPRLTSVLSAFGAATADARRERSQMTMAALPASPETLAAAAAQLRAQVETDLDADGIAANDRNITFEFDLRFARQQWELTMAAEAGFDPAAQEALVARFKVEYQRRYGAGALVSGAPVELVAIRAVGTGKTVRATLANMGSTDGVTPQPLRHRPVHIERHGAITPVVMPVFALEMLRPGNVISGPALIEARDTTIWLPDQIDATLDRQATLNIRMPHDPAN